MSAVPTSPGWWWLEAALSGDAVVVRVFDPPELRLMFAGDGECMAVGQVEPERWLGPVATPDEVAELRNELRVAQEERDRAREELEALRKATAHGGAQRIAWEREAFTAGMENASLYFMRAAREADTQTQGEHHFGEWVQDRGGFESIEQLAETMGPEPSGALAVSVDADRITADAFGGNCPVQGCGQLDDGQDWYFRARGMGWSFAIGKASDSGYVAEEDATWEAWGTWVDAGWLPQETAAEIVRVMLDLRGDGRSGGGVDLAEYGLEWKPPGVTA